MGKRYVFPHNVMENFEKQLDRATRLVEKTCGGILVITEGVFGMAGERLVVSHEAGQSAEPYVSGTLLAAKKVSGVSGLVRGLDELLFS